MVMVTERSYRTCCASSFVAGPPTLGRLVIVIGPRPSDRLDEEDAQCAPCEFMRAGKGSYTSSFAALPPTRGRLVVVAGLRPSDRRDDVINVYQFNDYMQVRRE